VDRAVGGHPVSLQVRKYVILAGVPLPDRVEEWLGVGFQRDQLVAWAVARPGGGPTWVEVVLTGQEPPWPNAEGRRPLHIGTAQLERAPGEYFVAHLWQTFR
jgi:hypothetical protein